MKRLLGILLFAVSITAQNTAEEDPVARARSLAIAGQRAEALRILETRLAERPDDSDARVLYGTVLSWDAQYDRAREELQRVIASDPNNADARAALANVERWSRTRRTTREASVGATYEDFAGADWTELHASARMGIFVARAAHAARGDLDDQQVELEAYPRLGTTAYAYVTAAASTDGTLYPDWRLGAEYFRGFGNGFEGSVGYRRLAFENDVDLFTASLGKYAGNWFFLGRAYQAEGDLSWQALARRYHGDEGSYMGLRAGTARDEIRSGLDVIALDERELAAEVFRVVASRWTFGARAGVVRREGDNRARAAVTFGVRY